MKFPLVSLGRLTTLWLIMRIVAKYKGIRETTLFGIARSSSLRAGGSPINDAYQFGLIGEFFFIEKSSVYLTDTGKKITDLWKKDEPNSKILREILLQLIIYIKPTWLVFSKRPLKERVIAIPDRWRNVLESAELLAFPITENSQEWWGHVQDEYDRIEENQRRKTGDIGECLTMDFEMNRLLADSEKELAGNINWRSRESDDFGYDIESFLSVLFSKIGKKDEGLKIEVKASVFPFDDNFKFFITRNEWRVAMDDMKHYYFYCWADVVKKPGNINCGNGPIIVSAEIIDQYVPIEIHSDGKWVKCKIELKFEDIQSDIINLSTTKFNKET